MRYLVLLFLLITVGCAGGTGDVAPGPRNAPAPEDTPSSRDMPPVPGGSQRPASETDLGLSAKPGEYDVTITTTSGLIYVDRLELEFNRRRGIHAFYGFYEDRFDKLETIAWNRIERIDIQGVMPQTLFEQAILSREDQNYRRETMFETRIRFKDQTTILFYAIIPKLRGEKDFRLWELTMTNNAPQVEYIEFNR